MIKIKNSIFISFFENRITISKIGKIDMDVIEDTTYYSLYYKLPLIERLVLEIYKSVPGTNIELFEQGIMKTINSVINNNQSFGLLPSGLIEKINIYFNDKDDSPRNIVFHEWGEDEKELVVDFEELNYIISSLLAILSYVTEKYKLAKLEKIEKL